MAAAYASDRGFDDAFRPLADEEGRRSVRRVFSGMKPRLRVVRRMLGLHFGGSAATEGRRHCHEASRALGGRGWRSACRRASRVRSTCGRPMHLRRSACRPFGLRPPPHRRRSAGREPRRWRPYSWFPPGIRGSLRSSSPPPVGDRPEKGARDAHRCGPRTSGSPRPIRRNTRRCGGLSGSGRYFGNRGRKFPLRADGRKVVCSRYEGGWSISMSPSRSWSRFSRFSSRSDTKRHRSRSLELTTRSVVGVDPLGVRLAPATRDRALVRRARLAARPGAASARAQRAAHDADPRAKLGPPGTFATTWTYPERCDPCGGPSIRRAS